MAGQDVRALPMRRVDRVSQAMLRVVLTRGDADFASIRDVLLDWLQQKAGAMLPDTMRRGAADTLDSYGAQRVETVALADPRVWAARQDDQDGQGRTWVTEVMLAIDGSTALVGVRLHRVALRDDTAFERTIPRFLREVAQRFRVLLDGVETDSRAEVVETIDDADRLVALILDPTRRSPVIAIAAAEAHGPEAIAADGLASNVLGTAHVRVVSRSASFRLSERLGKRLSVFSGAARIWWPECTLEDDPYNHPLWLAGRIAADGEVKVRRVVTEQVLRASTTRRDADHTVPSFAEARRIASTVAREQAASAVRSDTDMLALYETENRQLLHQINDAKETFDVLLATQDEDIRRLITEQEDTRREFHSLSQRILHMEGALRAREHKPRVVYPEDFENLEAWAELYLCGAVELLPRALRAARKSDFGNPPLAYQALLLLSEAYVPMRQGSQHAKQRWEEGLRELGLECSPTQASARAGENPEDHFTSYNGRRVEISLHLKGSSSRDPRCCFRLYFFWWQDTEKVVVASLPSHLENRMT